MTDLKSLPAALVGTGVDNPATGASVSPGARIRSREDLKGALMALGAENISQSLFWGAKSEGAVLGISFQEVLTAAELSDLLANISTHASQIFTKKMQVHACSVADSSCRKKLFADILQNAWALPPGSELNTAVTKYDEMASKPVEGETQEQATIQSIAVILLSPRFLMNPEVGLKSSENNQGIRRLSPTEIALRFYSLVYSRRPSEKELESAELSALSTPDGRLERLRAALKTDAGVETLGHIVERWLIGEPKGFVTKSASVKKGLPDDFESKEKEQFDLFVKKILSDRSAPHLKKLFTSNNYPATSAFESIYNIPGLGTSWGEIDLSQRKGMGVLTLPTVLMRHTGADGASPFHSGKSLSERLTCTVISPPPPGADAMAPGMKVDANLTLRESLEKRTAAPVCQSCHTKFSPVGFSILGIDPVGRFSATDPVGKPWNTAGVLKLGSGESINFSDATSFATNYAGSSQATSCLTHLLFRWTFGRSENALDADLLEKARAAAKASGGNFDSILETFVKSEAFETVILR